MKLTAKIFAILFFFVLASLTGCRNASYSPELEEIDRIIAESPDSALAELGRISPDSLSEPDRNLHSLLSLKAADKNYVRHTSDSLILRVLDYYDRHKNDPRYPEALYYGGRVYSDIGDLPTALKYFQSALDEDKKSSSTLKFRSNVLFQTAYLLNSMRLYDEAIPYLEECISIERQLKDPDLLADDLQTLGHIFMYKKDFDKAMSLFQESKQTAMNHSDYYTAYADMYIAAVRYEEGKWREALNLIRGVPERLSGNAYAEALTYAANIYLKNSIIDTAYIYADELSQIPNSRNRHLGYELLLDPLLRNLVPPDSLNAYINEFSNLTEDRINENGNELNVIQRSRYNYDSHERKREAAEQSKALMLRALEGTLLLILLCVIIILYLKNRNRRRVLELVVATRKIEDLRNELKETKESLEKPTARNKRPKAAGSVAPPDPGKTNVEENLRNQFVTNLLALLNAKSELEPLPESLVTSKAYKTLQSHIADGSVILDTSPFWDNLEAAIEKSFPDFMKHLLLLTQGKFVTSERRMAMLLKCGVPPRSLQTMLSISKGGVSSRRIRFGLKLFDKKLSTADIDRLIRYI